MLEILICSPDKKKKELLKVFVSKTVESFGRAVSYSMFSYPVDMLDYMYHSSNISDIVIVDSQCSGESGLEVSKMIKEKFPNVRIIIVGDVMGMAEDLFSVPVDGWIQNCQNEESIRKCVSFIIKRIDTSSRKHISLKSKNKFVSFRIEDIVVCMSDKRKVIIREFSDHEFYLKLDELQEYMGDEFIRCHQSYLVNMRKIKSFDNEGITLIDNSFVPISQKKYYAIKKVYQNYIKDNHSITVIDV